MFIFFVVMLYSKYTPEGLVYYLHTQEIRNKLRVTTH